MKLPRTFQEAMRQGYHIEGEHTDNVDTCKRSGQVLLKKEGDERPDGHINPFFTDYLVVPFTATYKFGKPRRRRESDHV